MAGAVALLLAVAGGAVAQEEADARRDLHCMAVFMAVADSDDPEMVNAGSMGAIYFYGRLQGREPRTDWLRRLLEFSERITEEELYSRGQECADDLERMGREMEAIGRTAG